MPRDVMAGEILESFYPNFGKEIFIPSAGAKVCGMRRTSIQSGLSTNFGEGIG